MALVLEGADDIVHVDLRKREVALNRALEKALSADDDGRLTAVYLRDLDTFVSIRGQFHATETTTTTRTFEAPFGNSTDDPQAHISRTCMTSGIRRETVPNGSFRAHCLGRVEDWNSETGKLKVHTVAIFC